MKRTKLNIEVRQEQIVREAMNLIASQGSRRLSVSASSNKTGLVPSALYRHFKSKDAILDSILDFIPEKRLNN
jgi:AcrR family transcriptional regulator